MDEGKFDYLLVETSGVTDPLSIIASLEKNFGKLYRAHLDTVVTVLDADTTFMFIRDSAEMTDAAKRYDALLNCSLLSSVRGILF